MLAPLGVVYGAAMRARLALYRVGAFRSHRIDAPVISVGNITTGGTGKTPLVEWLARAVAGDGFRVCILTRGYGRASAMRVVVSDGTRLLADAREGGDEPRLLAEQLLGVAAVVSDADRVAAARWARENLTSDVFILDDGFQHLRIARDLDIVTIDGAKPWGGGQMLPRGRLREPLKNLERAGLIVITRSELAADLAALRAEAERLSDGRAAIFTTRTRTSGLRPLDTTLHVTASPGSHHPAAVLPSLQPAAAFCALGNPQAFFRHLRRDGHDLNHTRAFADHHRYTQRDVDALTNEAVERGARALLTTAKDAVKLRALRFALPCYVVEIALEIAEEDRMLAVVRQAISHRGQS